MPARQAVPSAVPDADFLAKQGTSANSHLMPTGAAPFVWDQATRTDLWLDIILSVCVFDLLGTEGATRALELRCRAVGEHADRGAHLACRAAFAEGLDELAHRPARPQGEVGPRLGRPVVSLRQRTPLRRGLQRGGLDDRAQAWQCHPPPVSIARPKAFENVPGADAPPYSQPTTIVRSRIGTLHRGLTVCQASTVPPLWRDSSTQILPAARTRAFGASLHTISSCHYDRRS